MIAIDKVTQSYPNSVKALEDVSAVVSRGEFCVLLGKSGAGKSTLLKLCNGLVTPTRGKVFVDQIEVGPQSLRRIRSQIGSVDQKFHLVPRLPVLDNVLAGALPVIPLPRAICRWYPAALQRRACELLADVGLEEKHLYRRAARLSGGQQQRVAVARAFMLQPKLVLADEPVASLDPETGATILKLIRHFSQANGATVLCSLHQIEFARAFADRIIGLNRGKVVFDGPPSELSEAAINQIYANDP